MVLAALYCSTVLACCFYATCSQVAMWYDGRFGACCNSGDGKLWVTGIRLDQCVGNAGGKLVPAPNGAMSITCRSCWIGGSQLTCECHDGSTGFRSTTLDLVRKPFTRP